MLNLVLILQARSEGVPGGLAPSSGKFKTFSQNDLLLDNIFRECMVCPLFKVWPPARGSENNFHF